MSVLRLLLTLLIVGVGSLPRNAAGQANVRERAREIGSWLAQMRGLAPAPEPAYQVLSTAAFEGVVREGLEEVYPRERVALLEQAFVELGLWEPGQDLHAALLGFRLQLQAAHYDRAAGRVALRSGLADDELDAELLRVQMAVLHEHHFQTEQRLAALTWDLDDRLGLAAVVEASASAALPAWLLQRYMSTQGQPDVSQLGEIQGLVMRRMGAFRSAPPLLLALELAPRQLGARLVGLNGGDMVQGRLDNAHLDELLRLPPRSSEQLLDPARRRADDRPESVDLAPLPALEAEGWALSGSGSLGQLLLGQVLSTTTPTWSAPPEDWLHPATDGWEGDIWHLYARAEERVVVLRTRWEQPEQALVFSRAAGERGFAVRTEDHFVWLATGVGAEAVGAVR